MSAVKIEWLKFSHFEIELVNKNTCSYASFQNGLFLYVLDLYFKFNGTCYQYNQETDTLEVIFFNPRCRVKRIKSMKCIPTCIHKFLLDAAISTYNYKVNQTDAMVDSVSSFLNKGNPMMKNIEAFNEHH